MSVAKYGDPTWKKNHPLERELDDLDKQAILTTWQRTESLYRCAQHANTTQKKVKEVLKEIATKDPHMLIDPQQELDYALNMQEKADLLHRLAMDNVENLVKAGKVSVRGLIAGEKYAHDFYKTAMKHYIEATGGEVKGSKEDIKAELDALREERGRYTGTPTGAEADGTGSDGAVGVDAG
jgi:hypothetical protein